MKRTFANLLLLSALLAPPLVAAELQTDWIQPVEGFEESTLGAKLKAVVVSPESGDTTVTIAIPKAAVDDEKDIQEVIVYGKKPDAKEIKIDIRHQWLADYDKDNYGLVLFLGKAGNIPLRLYLKAHEEP